MQNSTDFLERTHMGCTVRSTILLLPFHRLHQPNYFSILGFEECNSLAQSLILVFMSLGLRSSSLGREISSNTALRFYVYEMAQQ